jgi:tRNA threonylcarbamoyladenosine biosynthesis protein TsaB
MLILALDTTTRAGSLALWRDGLVEVRVGDAARSHAERLPGDLAALLADHGLGVGDVELYAVAAGPGSFTGMRVGIATMQALALVHGRPIAAVSALEALAQEAAAGAPGVAWAGAWMEAYRGEVFAELYRVEQPPGPGTPHPLATLRSVDGPRVGTPEALADGWARVAGAPIAVAGDGLARTAPVLRAKLPAAPVEIEARPLAGSIAALAASRPHAAGRPHAVVPLYVRPSDAEKARNAGTAPALP